MSDIACESCGRRGRLTLDVVFPYDRRTFHVCGSCAEDAVRNGDARVVLEATS